MIEPAHARRERADAAEPSDQRDVRRTSRRASRLTVGAADDALEREADRVADEVIARMPASCFDGCGPTRIVRSTATPRVEPEVGYEGGEISPQLAGRIGSASGGAPLRGELRDRMEHAFGADFGGVRIHAASPLPVQVAAEAFTLGSRIHFAPGRYDPASRTGQRLLAHELTHVVQQTGHVRRMSPVIQRDLGFEFESDGFRTRRTHNKGGSLPATPFPDAGTAMATFSRNGTTRVAKGKALLAKPDIEIQADDRGTDSDLEAVTTHFPETTNGRQRLAQAMNDLDLLIRDGDAKAAGHIVTTKAIAGTAGFTNKMKDGMIYGAWNAATTAPQVTMGVRVSSIPDIVKDLHGSPNESAGKATSRAPGRLKMRDAKATDVTKPKKLQAGNESKTLVDGHQLAKQAIVNYQAIDHAAPGGKELEGFLTIIFTYVEGARNKRSFLKSHTPLMAKTDLATVWGTLPGPVQAYYGAVNAAGVTAFERLVRAAPGYNNRLGQPLFVIPAATKGSIVENNKATNQRQWYEKLTLSSWLRGIAIDRTRTPTQAIQDFFLNTPIGVDQLSDKHFPSKPRDQEVEGYAALGSRMDATGATPLPVFELRSATKQIRFSEASQWALKLFDYVRSLNANPGGGHTRIT